MKYSQFNSIILFGDKYVLYNAYTNIAIVLDPLLKDLLVKENEDSINYLKNIHPSLYEVLESKEFIVENSIDEVDKVKIIRNVVDFNEETYHLTINPTMNCNFKCWYCYETHVTSSRMDEEISNRINLFLTKQLTENEKLRSFTLSWFGGEPLLYYYNIVLPIIKHFNIITRERGIQTAINFTSNAFLVNEKMVKSFKENYVDSLQITLDGYGPDHDLVRNVNKTRGSYAKIIENVILMVQSRIFIRLRINFTSKNIINAHNIINDINILNQEDRKFIVIDFHRVWQDNEDDDNNYIQSQIDKFRTAGFLVSSYMYMNNVRESCYADKKNSAVINYNGDVFKCTARDFTTANRDSFINENGELVWENNSLEKRMDSKFKNRPCLSCRLLPICNGGCSQHAVENNEVNGEFCLFDYNETRKSEVIIQKVKELIESL